ncbi:MAG TPA: flavodoxin domain-containing protein [Thermoplasmata archaeon]
MRVTVVYDSVYGNTEKVAKAIGAAIAGEVRVAKVGEVSASGLQDADLLVLGSPTLGGRPTEPMQGFLASLSEAQLKGKKAAAFDTRYAGRFVKVFGFAAEKMSESLTAKGATLVAPPQPFIVTGKKGPLKEGELERAASWAKEISK